MTGYQIFALSMPVITAAAVAATALFVRWRWGRRGQIHHADAAIATESTAYVTGEVMSDEEVLSALSSAIRLIDGVRRKLQITPN